MFGCDQKKICIQKRGCACVTQYYPMLLGYDQRFVFLVPIRRFYETAIPIGKGGFSKDDWRMTACFGTLRRLYEADWLKSVMHCHHLIPLRQRFNQNISRFRRDLRPRCETRRDAINLTRNPVTYERVRSIDSRPGRNRVGLANNHACRRRHHISKRRTWTFTFQAPNLYRIPSLVSESYDCIVKSCLYIRNPYAGRGETIKMKLAKVVPWKGIHVVLFVGWLWSIE